MKTAAYLVFFIFIPTCVFCQVNVNSNQSAIALAQKLAGQGVSILNPILTCPAVANGLFTVTQSNLGISDGILLTTGNASAVSGYAETLASGNNHAPGDPQLEALANNTTYDACILELDFVPTGDTIRFKYVFGSEEYNNATCGPYNDAFAFYISGPGINGQENIALVPGTNIPVMVNTVNNGIPGTADGNISNCTSLGTGSPFTQYYVDNSNGTTLAYKGFTDVFTAVHTVQPCNTYHLKLTIADGGNATYDSGVFLQAGSLQTNTYHINATGPITNDSLYHYSVKGCLPAKFTVKRSQIKPGPQTIKLLAGGNAVSNIDYTQIPSSVVIPANDSSVDLSVNTLATPVNGQKTLVLYMQSPADCNGNSHIIDSASVIIYDTLHISMLTPDTTICGGYPISLQVMGNDILSYSWGPTLYLNNASIKNPIARPEHSITYVVTASLPGTPCPVRTAQISLSVKSTPVVDIDTVEQVCDNKDFTIGINVDSASINYTYQWNGPDGFISTKEQPVINNVTGNKAGVYTVTVTNETNACAVTDSFRLKVISVAMPEVTTPVIFCQGYAAGILSADGDDLLWYEAGSDSAMTSQPQTSTVFLATYQYFVTQTQDGCESPKAEIDVQVEKCCDGVIYIPNAFTPNNDGRNDRFEVKMDYGYFIKRFNIYNTWGQLIFHDDNNGSWDGTFGGRPVEVGTYYYEVTLGCINGGLVEKKGDIILIR